LTVEKVPSHPLAKRHRADIEGCINPDNSAIVVSILVAEFKFPHEVDVHRIVSTEFLGAEILFNDLYLRQWFLTLFFVSRHTLWVVSLFCCNTR
jgi:hypothetical protein